MIIFLDENDVEYGALATIKATNAVNGERSITGTIVSGDYVLSKIERGWRLRFDDEYYVVTFAKPIDEGKNVQVSFDAVHQFFWDFGKSSVYDQLSDGSHTFRAYLDFIFNDSGYRYDIESSLTVKAFDKQSFGYKNRLSLFNDIITSSGVEFQVNGKVVRILAKVGTDLSTVVRKNFNLNELGIEKNIGNFVTYQKGFGAYFDEEDHSKGRLIVEYTSPLASVYGRLEADPLVDERYKQSESLLSALKETVDNSYTISVSLDMEDLTRAGYRYTQPVAGDYIMAINETLGFKEKIRIVSFTSEYDVAGQLIKHTVTCNDIGSVKKLSASYTQTQHQAANAEVNANTAYEFANKALVSANGKNTNYYGDTFPVDNPKGTLKKGDLLFLTVGDTVKQYYWNGAEWVTNPVVSDVEAFKEQIAEELKDVPNREEFENKISEELATSKAEIETQIETAKTQAESNAKEYADTINQETAKVAELANAAAGEIKADLVNVKNNLTSTSLVANNAQAAVDAAKQDLANVTSDLNTAKQDLANSVAEVNTKVDNAKEELTQAKQQLTTVANDLSQAKTDLQTAVSAVDTKATNLKNDLTQAKQDLVSQAQQLQAQASAQSELTKRVSSVEKTADGTKTTVSELSKTVAQNGKDITSVTARTKTVEDDLAGTKTTLSQVKTTADSTSQKTATLETGLNGLNAKFDNLKIGGRNLLSKTNQGKTNWAWKVSSGETTAEDYNVDGINAVKLTRTSDASFRWDYIQYKGLLRKLIEPNTKYTLSFDVKPSVDVTFSASLQRGDGGAPLTNAASMNKATANQWTKVSCVLTSNTTLPDDLSQVVYLSGMPVAKGNWLIIKNIKLEKGNVATDYSPSEVDFEQKVAEYKQTADQNYASLQTTVQNLDGTVQHNKTVADQTAQGFTTRIESLETYKNGESERANAYFESAKTETAKQLTAERTAIAKDYVAKSTYTSDVTGIRNELSATTSTANTTKTNLANYQASNDRAVANLQSNIQTANGDISSLKTKVEAVPGQITSAVSAVEGKIPTSIGGRNLWIQSKATGGFVEETLPDNHITGQKKCYRIPNNQQLKFNIEPDFSSRLYRKVTFSAWVKYENVVQGDNSWNKFNCFKHELYRKNSSTGVTTDKNNLTLEGFTGTSDWKHITYTYDYAADKSYDQLKTSIRFNLESARSGTAWVTGIKIEIGSIPSDYSPAPEDTISQIDAVSSELKQTKDGITLLATKTELSTAKNELQSGINTATNKANAAQNAANNNAQTINTHTTQISALNTGLQAKVSQTEFNTLSGRVTSAENNITAKANELSSKITSVEGKIPTTSSGGRNLAQGTSKDWSKPFTGFSGIQNTTIGLYRVLTDGLAVGDTIKTRIVLKHTDIRPASGKTAEVKLQGAGNVTEWNSGAYPAGGGGRRSISGSGEIVFELTDKINADHLKNSYWSMSFRTDWIASGSLQWRLAKAERGMFFTDWSPAPEDTAEQISNLSSEIKQTADGMTLLATKTELNTAKNELQSGINTATNKANNAQSTANNNAQTISTHTTQISALNTGLQAKVSQTEFNTLSGRVTNAENNITAKANELSSKITSVEGKIPTSVGGRNLWIQSKATGGFVEETLPDNHVTGQKKCYRIPNNQKLYFNIEPDFSSRLYQKVTFSAWVKYENVVQGDNSWNKFNCFKHELYRKNSSTGVTTDKNNLTLEGFTGTSDWKHITYTYDYAADKSYDQLKTTIRFNLESVRSGTAWVTGIKIEVGSIPSDYSPAPEDTESDIEAVSSQIKQTADGMTLLATKTELNTAKSELQSGINTATNKANNAQNTANSAQSAANNNAQTISTHTTQISALNTGLSAKVSQSEFNTLSGRVTTAENNITAKANELSSKITSVESKIPTEIGAKNLIKQSTAKTGVRLSSVGGELQDQAHSLSDWIKIEPNTTYTLTTYENVTEAKMWYSLAWYSSNANDYSGWISRPTGTATSADLKGGKQYQAPANATYAKVSYPTKYAKFKLERGKISTDYTTAPEDTTSQISNLSSEIKQTTDSIKASVSSLDKSTVKSSSLTINSDGIVMKAGKTTTDVANAIGSYFAVNQNAINLFSDKINVKGNMIVSGAITSDKIASKSINTSHLNGKIITADVIATNAITADAIKAGAVTTDKMSANSINGDRITAGTLDAAKIKAGSITASQIASGTITSNQIKAGGISSANIAAGAITGDKIAAGAIDANKIAANAITANMIRGGQLNSTNGATVFDLNAGTLTFNNNYGYIQRVASDKVFEITTHLSTSSGSQEFLTSAFNIRKSDNSRQAGVKFTLYNTVADKPTAEAKINADALILYDSQSTRLFSMHGKSTFAGSVNFQGWGDIPIAKIHGGLVVNDIGIGSHMKPLLAIVEELCKKAGILWV